jgi:hypothetical protein
MDIKDVHSEHGQGNAAHVSNDHHPSLFYNIGELVDDWEAEAGGERAATLARRGFLPELTPVLAGVTAPVPQVITAIIVLCIITIMRCYDVM